MKLTLLTPEFTVIRDEKKCIQCEVCVRQCAFEVHSYDSDAHEVLSDDLKCAGCQRCVTLCPTQALTVVPYAGDIRPNPHWSFKSLKEIYKQAQTGGVLLASMGTDRPYANYWDRVILDASQVTNPSIDPLREPMELKTFLGKKPDSL
ncbi:MAG: 4Fe-4S dicluster domain-containing protein, partial [Elusimicrobiota bacterium]